MTDETQDSSIMEQAQVVEVEVTDLKAAEPTAEEKAREKGWRPKEEYKGESEWVDAETYLRNGSYLREISKLKKIITTLSDTMSKSEERAYKRALSEIEQKKKAAELSSDISKYKEAEHEAAELNKQFNVTQAKAPVATKEDPAYKAWAARNRWFENPQSDEDLEKIALAKAYSSKFATENRGASFEEELAFVEQKINARFKPESDVKQKITSPSTTKATSGRSSSEDISGLSSAEKQVVEYLKRTGQDYKNYLKAVRSSKN